VAVAVAEQLFRRAPNLYMFGFQKLDVYRCAVTFLGVASTLAERIPRGHSHTVPYVPGLPADGGQLISRARYAQKVRPRPRLRTRALPSCGGGWL